MLVSTGSALLTGLFATGLGPLGQALVLGAYAALVPTMNVVIGTSEMLLTPTELQGRTQSATSFLAICLQPLAPVMAPPRLTFLAFSALLAAVAIFSGVHRAFRDLPDPRFVAPATTPDRGTPAGAPTADAVTEAV